MRVAFAKLEAATGGPGGLGCRSSIQVKGHACASDVCRFIPRLHRARHQEISDALQPLTDSQEDDAIQATGKGSDAAGRDAV